MVYQVESKEDYDLQLTNAGSKLVVVDFFATWCRPCKKISPGFADLHTVFPNVVYLKVDVDIASEVSNHYDIRAMPTFLFVQNGKELDRQTGADLAKLVDKIKIYNTKIINDQKAVEAKQEDLEKNDKVEKLNDPPVNLDMA
jgi:thioredoxin 1